MGKNLYESNTVTARSGGVPDPDSLKEYFYTTRDDNQNVQWGDSRKPLWYLLESSGPDQMKHYLGRPLNQLAANSAPNKAFISRIVYDASNGTVSRGSLWRVGGSPVGRGKVAADVINEAN